MALNNKIRTGSLLQQLRSARRSMYLFCHEDVCRTPIRAREVLVDEDHVIAGKAMSNPTVRSLLKLCVSSKERMRSLGITNPPQPKPRIIQQSCDAS